MRLVQAVLGRSLTCLAIAALVATPLAAQGGPPPEVRAMIDGAVGMLQGTADSTLTSFAETQLAPAYRESFSPPKLIEHLQGLRAIAASGDGSVSVRGTPGSVVITLAEDGSVQFRLEWNEALKITKLVEEPGDG
jgi:hypothetical protein